VAARSLAQDVADQPNAVSAVQERAYRMMHEFDLSVGLLPLDPFSKGLFAQGSYTVHFSDTFAWQIARGAYSYTAKTELRSQLERDFGFLPTAFEEVQFFFGTDILLKPLYGKLSVMNKWVVHGEFFVILGATLFKFTASLRPGVNLGLGGRIFLNKTLSLRLDVSDNVVIPLGAGQNLTNVMAMTLSLGINIGATE
jgi:outer membrane beta-barrel protein